MQRRNFRTFVSGVADVTIVDHNSSAIDSNSSGFMNKSSGNKEVDALLFSLSGIFKNLDDKIESIKSRIDGDSINRKESYNCETINISGSGMLLRSAARISEGEIIIIRMNIFTNPYPLFEAFGKVIRSIAEHSSDGCQYYSGIKFINLDSEQRERLISYTFHQQRKYIRAFNKSIDARPDVENLPADEKESEAGFSGRL